MKKVKTLIFGGGHFEKIQYGHHQELITLGTPSKIDHYDLTLPQKKFGAFVRRVNIWPYFDPKAPSYCHHNLLNDSYPGNHYISGKHAILPSRNPIEGNLIAFILEMFMLFYWLIHGGLRFPRQHFQTDFIEVCP